MGLVYLVIYGGFAVCILAFISITIFLYKKKYKKIATLILLAGVSYGLYPSIPSYIEGYNKAKAAEALSYHPKTIDFKNKRVLFVESGGTICHRDICGYALMHGGLETVYWTSSNISAYDFPENIWPFDAIAQTGPFYEMGLTDPQTDSSGLTLPDPIATHNTLPDVDYTVLADDSFFVHGYEDALGLTGQLPQTIRFSYMIYEGWPTPEKDPIARLLTVQYHTEPPFIWPVSTDFHYSPEIFTHRDIVRSWFCAAPREDEYFGPESCPQIPQNSTTP